MGDVAIDPTISETVSRDDLKGQLASVGEINLRRRIVVCQEKRKRLIPIEGTSENIEVYPWKQFAEELWQGKIL